MARSCCGLVLSSLTLIGCGIDIMDHRPHTAPVCSEVDQARRSIEALPTSEVAWDLTLDVRTIRRITLGVEFLYVESEGGRLIAINRRDGMTAWAHTHPLGHTATWAPVEVPDVVRRRMADEAEEVRLLEEIRVLSRRTRLSPEDFKQIETLRLARSNAGGAIQTADAIDNLFFITDNELTCLERKTGRPLWSRRLDYAAAARPVASPNAVYVPCAYPARVVAHPISAKGRDSGFYRSAMVERDNFIMEAPLFEGQNLIFPTNDGAIYAYDTRTKDRTVVSWLFGARDTIREPISAHTGIDARVDAAGKPVLAEPDGKITVDPAKGKQAVDTYNMVLASALNRQLFAIDSSSGSTYWQFPLGGYADGPAIGSGETIYVRVQDDSLKALDAVPAERGPKGEILRTADGKIQRLMRNGRLRWQLPGGERFMVRLGGGRVLVLGPHRELYLMDDATGRTLGRFSTFGLDFMLTNVQDGMFYVATQDGRLWALREHAPRAE